MVRNDLISRLREYRKVLQAKVDELGQKTPTSSEFATQYLSEKASYMNSIRLLDKYFPEAMMRTRHFVKEPSDSGLGNYDVLYEGEDQGLAEEIAKNLPIAIMSTYVSTPEGISESKYRYKEGSVTSYSGRGMHLRDPLENLIHENALEGNHPNRVSMSELLAEFTPIERSYLRSIEKEIMAAA